MDIILRNVPAPSALRSLQPGNVASDSHISAAALLHLLIQSRRHENVSALDHLGVDLGHWDAVMWIVRRISAGTPEERRPARAAVGEILQSLGGMIVHATDAPPQESAKIMAHVLQIIAHLHHIDALPSNIYHSAITDAHATLYNPPTLHLWSSQILAALSDAVWTAHEKLAAVESAAKDAQGKEASQGKQRTSWRLNTPQLAPEAWMEFLLWTCVQGDFIVEGASIVQQLLRRNTPSQQWSVVAWDVERNAPAARSLAQMASDREPSNQPGPHSRLPTKNRRPASAVLTLGTKRISNEVVKAFIDGLVRLPHLRGFDTDHSPDQIVGLVQDLKDFMARGGYRSDQQWWDQMVSRVIDALGPGLRSHDGAFGPLLRLVTDWAQANKGFTGSGEKASFGQTSRLRLHWVNASIELLCHQLSRTSQSGNFSGARVLLGHFQYVPSLNQLLPTVTGSKNDTQPSRGTPLVDLHLPVLEPLAIALASFFNLLVQKDQTDWAGGLLSKVPDAQASFVEKLYQHPLLQEALIRFAGLTANHELFNQLEASAPSLSVQNLRALLESEVQTRRWKVVPQLLEALKLDPERSWDANLAMRLTAMVLPVEVQGESNNGGDKDDRSIAQGILKGLLDGEYGPPESERLTSPDRTNAYVVALRRVIADATEDASFLEGSSAEVSSRLVLIDKIPVHGFNILLHEAVRRHGPFRGQRMWELWCENVGGSSNDPTITSIPLLQLDFSVVATRISDAPGSSSAEARARQPEHPPPSCVPGTQAATAFPVGSSKTALVRPNLGTLEIVAEAALQAYNDVKKRDRPASAPPPSSSFESEQRELRRLFAWIDRKCRDLGLDEKRIRTYIPDGVEVAPKEKKLLRVMALKDRNIPPHDVPGSKGTELGLY